MDKATESRIKEICEHIINGEFEKLREPEYLQFYLNYNTEIEEALRNWSKK
tara:strand:- start:554 stop:706 length:153 start_codon:yes stop_codon:yes gene_type:complete